MDELAQPEQFKHISLTEEEAAEALRQGRMKKHFEIMRETYSKKLAEPEIQVRYTSEQLFEEISKAKTFRGHEFATGLKDELYASYVLNLCYYFTGDSRFTGDLSKGLALFGNVGTSKTSLMKYFGRNQVHSFRTVSMMEVVDQYKSSDKDAGEKAMKPYFTNAFGEKDKFGNQELGYCFDDVGTEQIPAQHYGNTMNVFAEIIQRRHMNVVCTHFSSNKDPQEFEKLYGTRVYDRLREMFNVITFDGVDSFR